MKDRTLLPGSTVGVLGGGQLGRMLAFEARKMGYKIHALDPTEKCPALGVVDECFWAPWHDLDSAIKLARGVDVVTVETELIPADLLLALEEETLVRPGSKVLRTVQDRLTQKTFLKNGGFPQADFQEVVDSASLEAAADNVGLPAVLKSRRAGYDGKGQARIGSRIDLHEGFERIDKVPAILESFVDFVSEVSVVLARGADGEVRPFPMVENIHRNHILHVTKAPASVDPAIAEEGLRIATGVAEELGHIGVIAVEMFLLSNGRLLVNEIAPRTHNSGHFSFGACVTSQFEQHLRAICGLSLADPHLLCPAIMVNMLGDLWSKGEPVWNNLLLYPNVKLHLYGKEEARAGRKMGHFLVLGDLGGHETLELADRILDEIMPTGS